MRRGLVFLLLLGRGVSAETLHLKPLRGQASLAVRAPVLTVRPGDLVSSETLGGEWYETGGGAWPGEVGPIEVLGAEPGDVLAVRVERIDAKGPTGVSFEGGGEMVTAQAGSSSHRAPRSIWHLDPREGLARLQGLPGTPALRLQPTLGRLGVAPPGEHEVPGSETGSFGGSLAMANVSRGTTVFLPVFHRGALISFGDGRATPWTGSTGSGLLTTVELTLRFDILKQKPLDWPRFEDATSLAVQARGPSLGESCRRASHALEEWLVAEHSLSPGAARVVRAEGASLVSTPGAAGGWVSLARIAKDRLPPRIPKGVRLGELSWVEAQAILTPDRVVVLPLGAASKEHGPHLLLRNDEILANYFAERTQDARPVALLPALTYGFYPAFLEYPGSTSLSFSVQRDAVAQICRSIARYGPRRFYVLNTGISTVRPLKATADLLAHEGILMRFSDFSVVGRAAEQAVREEAYGTHADEIETSMLLYIEASAVRMERAVADGAVERPGPLTRDPGRKEGHLSVSGVFGDPTLATWDKGRQVVEGMLSDILMEIDALGKTSPPDGEPRSPLDSVP